MSLFEEPRHQRRIATYLNYEYPVAADRLVYEQLDALTAQLHATHRPVHSVVGDPMAQPTSIRHLFGTGLLVTHDPEMQCNDVEHLRASLPDRFHQIASELAGLVHMSVPAMMMQPDFQCAGSGARWLRAWQPDLIISVGLSQFSLHSIVASYVLDVPRLLVLDSIVPDTPLLLMLPLYVQQASWILVAEEAIRQDLIARFGTGIDDMVFVRSCNREAPRHLIQSIRERIESPRTKNQPTLGPMAAFRTKGSDSPAEMPGDEEPGATPLLVLGAERTGTHLLVNMLADHRQIWLANELFNPRLIEHGIMPWNGACGVDNAHMKGLRLARPGEFFKALLRDGRTQSATYAGFKLLYYHGLVDDRVTDMLLTHDDLRVVHLIREHHLQRFTSHVRAQQYDKWSSQEHDYASAPGQVQLDLREMITAFVLTAQCEARYRAMLQDHQVLEIDYHELSSDLPGTMARLGSWLSLDLSLLTPKNRKTGPTDVKTGIANWHEVRRALQGTRWSELTEESA